MSGPFVTASAIIVAGGTGTRAKAMRDDRLDLDYLPKQLQMLAGKPVIGWSLSAFANDPRITTMIVVCPDDMRDTIKAMACEFDLVFAISGATRTASVRSGLALAQDNQADFVFIHDAARPGLTSKHLDALFSALKDGVHGAAPARPVADALWVSVDNQFDRPQPREGLLRVQTPQAFRLNDIVKAYARLPDNSELADDIAVARASGLRVISVEGHERLDKITWPEDFARMEALLSKPLLPRLGHGYDAHRFAQGKTFVTLCGIEVPHEKGLAGHSDADVGWHALADAIYGALGAGDIGFHFPPSDMKWKGAASSVFLAHAGDLVKTRGGVINHVDVTLICEAPKIGPHRDAMVAATARLLGLRADQVSVKATTTEGMGFTGRREGIAAQATATVLLPDAEPVAGVPL
jgi:2-C-methyl-D-erythritol 4-phosphate cytidylyltransferase / 2-C-methyl-D-erythritol 2,4-cyclodiphosphate synthase